MVNAKEEREYRELRRLGQKLHVPIPEAFWGFEVFDKDGKLIQKHKQRSHSWVRNAYNLLFCQLAGVNAADNTFGAGKLSIKLPDGTVKHGAYALYLGYNSTKSIEVADQFGRGYRGAAGEDSCGIQVGSGSVTAESFEDYVLETLISNGTGLGELSYTLQEPHSISYESASKILKNTQIRYFNNNSGGAVSVNEVALIGQGSAGGSYFVKWLQTRDKLASTVTVPDTGQLKVTYTVELSYPS